MADEKKKVCAKKKINHYKKEDCEKELARLAETKSEHSTYGEQIRARLRELIVK
jgi:hypothetical protein